jgi:TonB-dependent receptor
MNKRYSKPLERLEGPMMGVPFPCGSASRGSRNPLALRIGAWTLASLLSVGTVFGQTTQSEGDEPDEDVVEMEAFQVFTNSQNLALAAKRQNDRVGSFLSSDALGVLPDDNLGDALSRLAGVNVVGDQVVIRGAEGKLNNIQVDGLAPSNVSQDTGLSFGEADTRAFEVDQLPTELVESVEVIKSVTADLDGDAVGGIVNVKTANAFDYEERLMRYKAEYRYKDLNGDPGYGLTATFADRINDAGTMGLFINVNYRDEEDSGSELRVDYNPSLPGLDENGNPENVRRIRRIRPSAESVDRQELNINASFDWKVSDSTTLHAKAWYGHEDTLRLENEVRMDEGDESWKDYDNRGTVDAEIFLDGVVIDPVTNELVSVGNVTNNNEPGELTPLPADATDYRQMEEFRPIRLMNNNEGTEDRYRLMLAGETLFDNGGIFEFKGSLEQSTFDAYGVNNSWEGEAQEDTRIWRTYWDQSDPLRPNVTAVLKDVPLGSGQALDDNLGDSDAERIAEWIDDGWTPEQAQKMLAAGRTGENAPILIEADGTPVHWWEIADQSRIQVLDLINRRKFERTNDLITLQGDYSQELSETFGFKTGAKFRNEQRVTSAESKQWAQDFGVVEDGFGSALTLNDFQDLGVANPGITINDGLYAKAAGDFIDPILLANFQDENFADAAGRPYWRPVTPDSLRRIAAKNWEGEETVASAFFMGTWKPIENLTLNGGARFESTSTDFIWRGSDVDPPLPIDPVTGETLGGVTLPRVTDIRASKDYDNFLPSGYAVYRLENHVFRAAVSKTLARPDFDDLVPLDINQMFQSWGEFFGDPDNDVYIYNPQIAEQTSVNFDLAWEWYYAEGSMFSATLFRKDLKDFHLNQEVIRPDVMFPVLDDDTGLQEVDEDGNLVFDTEDQEIKFAGNGADRTIEGIELSFQQSFADLLPSPFDGFGTLINYTYMEGTETNTQFDPDALLRGEFVSIGEVESDGLSGQPEHIINAQLYWEKWGISTRVAYNYVSEYDREVFSPDRDQIRADYTQIDVSVQYRIPSEWIGGRDMRIFFEGRNLNKEREQEYDQNPLYTTYINAPQREFVFGIRGEF